jgi:hypothetical protein
MFYFSLALFQHCCTTLILVHSFIEFNASFFTFSTLKIIISFCFIFILSCGAYESFFCFLICAILCDIQFFIYFFIEFFVNLFVVFWSTLRIESRPTSFVPPCFGFLLSTSYLILICPWILILTMFCSHFALFCWLMFCKQLFLQQL